MAPTCCKTFCTWLDRTGNIFSVFFFQFWVLQLVWSLTLQRGDYHHELSIQHLVVLFLLVLITAVFQTVLLLLLLNLIVEVTCDIPEKNDEESQLVNRADGTSRDKTRATLVKYTVVVAILSLITQLWLHDWFTSSLFFHHPAEVNCL